jgi:hypothetical protein
MGGMVGAEANESLGGGVKAELEAEVRIAATESHKPAFILNEPNFRFM